MIGSALPVMAQTNDGWDTLSTLEDIPSQPCEENQAYYYKMYPCGWHDEEFAKRYGVNNNTDQSHFQASPIGSLTVSAKDKAFSGIVIGWTHFYTGEVTGKFGDQTGIVFDRDTFDFDPLHKYETGKTWLVENPWNGFVFDGWSKSIDGKNIIKNHKLPFNPETAYELSNPDDPVARKKWSDKVEEACANNKQGLYLCWHLDGHEDINQETWAKDYLNKIKYTLTLSSSSKTVCKNQTVHIDAKIGNCQTQPYANEIRWTVNGIQVKKSTDRFLDYEVPEYASGSLNIKAELLPRSIQKDGKDVEVSLSDYGTLQYGSLNIENEVSTEINLSINQNHIWKIYPNVKYNPETGKYGPGDTIEHETYSWKWKSQTCEACGFERIFDKEEIIHNQSYGGGTFTPTDSEPIETDAPKPEEESEGDQSLELTEPKPDDNQIPESGPQYEPNKEVKVDLPEEVKLSDKKLDSKTEVIENKEVTKTIYEDLHEETQIESEKVVSNYIETVDHQFAGAQVQVKESATPDENVSVEMKAIPVSTMATQPITLNASTTTNVSLPVENGNWGTIALLVDEDGKTYQIDSSYYDGSGNIVIPVNKNMKVVLQNRAKEFADVSGPINEYPANNIAFLTARGIMSGKSDGTNFDPTGNLTRGQFALMMYRKAGSPAGYNNTSAPAGVPENEYYANAAKWAVGTGLMGQGGSTFNGNTAITREQLALILYRQSGSQVETASLASYSDSGAISSAEAANAISWAINHNIMGNNTTALKPQANTMRQDIAAMVARWIQPAIAAVK